MMILFFATRKGPNDKGLRKIRGKELLREFDRLEEKLSRECPHVGFGEVRVMTNSKK